MNGSYAPIVAGELVDIHLARARVQAVSDDGRYLHLALGAADVPGVRRWYPLLDRAVAGVSVVRVAPVEWPPQPGDVWFDRNDQAWMALGNHAGDVTMGLARNGKTSWSSPDELLVEVGPLRLEYRHGWTPTPPAADQEPVEVDERAEYVARLRAVADFFETRTDLPAPNLPSSRYWHLTFQHTVIGYRGGDVPNLTDEERFAEVARAASVLGVDVSEDGQTVRYQIAAGMEYVVHTYGARPPAPVELPPVQRVDDAGDVPSVEEYERATAADLIAAATDDRGDAERIAQVEEDAAERRAVEAEARAEITEDDHADERPLPDDADNPQCTSKRAGQLHLHRCALYVDAGPHSGDHICVEDRCGMRWNDAGVLTALDRLVTGPTSGEAEPAAFTPFAVSSRDQAAGEKLHGMVVDEIQEHAENAPHIYADGSTS